jgi:hypothetical protein
MRRSADPLIMLVDDGLSPLIVEPAQERRHLAAGAPIRRS